MTGDGTGNRTRAKTHRADPSDIACIAAGLIVLVVCMLLAGDGNVSSTEEAIFHAVNDLPGGLYPIMWPVQQLGAIVVGPIVAVIAVLLCRYRLALAALIVIVAKLVAERTVKAIVTRERPGTSIAADITTRGDVSIAGQSFVSGHAMLVAALAGIVTPYVPGRWRVLPWLLVALVMFGRVYVGAHNPLDVMGGAGLGVAIAGAVNLALGRPTRVATT